MLLWRFNMSATNSQGTCIAFRTPRPEQFHTTAGDFLSLTFLDKAGPGMPDRVGDRFRSAGIDISTEESSELDIFDEFLARHVQVNRICDVQCMLLWSEWVRTFRRRMPGFPNLIRENEFRSVITDTFGVEIADDGFRGNVYPGIRFVP